jgi:dihydroorotate dehydrogenase
LLTQLFKAPVKPVQAFGLTFRNPVGLAAGYDKDALAIRGLAALGFGHLEVGTVTPRPQPGNPSPRVFRLPEDEAVINRMGFPSRGSEFMQKQLDPSLRGGITEKFIPRSRKATRQAINKEDVILGINLGKNKDTPNEEAVLDYLALLQDFAPYSDYLTINVSSPNTAGLCRLQEREELNALLTQLHAQRQHEEKRLGKSIPLLVKLSSDLSYKELDVALDVILLNNMDGLIISNSSIIRGDLRSNLAIEIGGLSGKPLAKRSTEMISRAYKLTNNRLPIIGVGGIMMPIDAKEKMDAGASLIQVYTGLIYKGPSLVKRIVETIN